MWRSIGSWPSSNASLLATSFGSSVCSSVATASRGRASASSLFGTEYTLTVVAQGMAPALPNIRAFDRKHHLAIDSLLHASCFCGGRRCLSLCLCVCLCVRYCVCLSIFVCVIVCLSFVCLFVRVFAFADEQSSHRKMVGAYVPAKIERFTLMCPIHGNL